MALGYSSRNKSLRVALLAAAVALGLLMLYLHGCARAEAASLHTALADAHGRHTRITDELKSESRFDNFFCYALLGVGVGKWIL